LNRKTNRAQTLMKTYQQVSVRSLVAIATLITVTSISPARAELFTGPVDRLPPIERDALRKGRVIVNGDNGNYEAKVLVKASPQVVWNVLTDYANLSQFIPNMASSKVLENKGDRKVVEQIDSRQVFLINVRSRTKLAIKETFLKQIDFKMVDGDLDSLQGYWKMELVSAYPGAKPNQVLITHNVAAQPKSSVPSSTFYDIFKGSLNETLSAVSGEILRRGN
jgi:ribosome-associated toxin RatA of RatAB toxin-antitoxin module